MNIISFKFYKNLSFYLFLGFLICTIIGTVSHELGHYIVAKKTGFNPKIHYQSVSYGKDSKAETMHSYYKMHKNKIISKEKSLERATFWNWYNQRKQMNFYNTLGGPLQTMLVGTTGFALLWFNRKKTYKKTYITIKEWIAVLLSYFWSRQVFNFIFSINLTFSEQKRFISDEPRLSQYLNLPPSTIGLITCVIGICILTWVTFRLIPMHERLTFLIAGLAGSTVGWFIWMDWLGSILLP